MNIIITYLPSLSLATTLGLVLWGLHWLLIGRHGDLGNERKFPRQLLLLALSLFGVVAVLVSLPITESSRNNLIGLLGLLVSGIIAFSSTNILANLMGGILLRMTKPFKIGDFIRVGEHFGRVTERGLFDTEMQTETRELIALPNAYLINHPIATTRSSGAIVSTEISLGFDVHHGQAEPLLAKAAKESGLDEPFVHIVALGDFSVTYRVSGLLVDTKRPITAHSNLCRSVLDTLHGHGIEIMSPTFVSQRRLSEDERAIPHVVRVSSNKNAEGGEDLVFDKAEQAEQMEKAKKELTEEIETLEASLKDTHEENKARIKKEIELAKERMKALEQAEAELDSEEAADQDQPGAHSK